VLYNIKSIVVVLVEYKGSSSLYIYKYPAIALKDIYPSFHEA
jgi:hypothetical protein